MKPEFTIRFSGNKVKPESFSLEDLQALLTEVKSAVREFGDKTGSVSLVSIKRQSAAYGFVSTTREISKAGIEGIIGSLSTSPLERTARQKKISEYFNKISNEKRCRVHFYDDRGRILYTYNYHKTIENVISPIKEHISIIGKITNVGNIKKPSAELSCADGKKVQVYGTTLEMRWFGEHLYQEVRVEGLAFIELNSSEIKIEKITSYNTFTRKNIADLFSELRDKFGDKFGFEDNFDPVAAQRAMRD